MNIADIKADREAGTPGDFCKAIVTGWGRAADNIVSIKWEDGIKPLATFTNSAAEYYTHQRDTDEGGGTHTTFSKPTDEGEAHKNLKRLERDANIRRFARVPQLEEAVIAAFALAKSVDDCWESSESQMVALAEFCKAMGEQS